MAVANLQRLSSQAHRLPSLSFFSKSLIYRRTSSSTKKVADRIVRLSAIDFVGKKHEVVGLAGQTLLKALINTGLVDPESHRLEEIDACAAHCEVNIAQEWLDKLPPRSYDEEYVLVRNSRARALNKHSRLGCQVLLDLDLEVSRSVLSMEDSRRPKFRHSKPPFTNCLWQLAKESSLPFCGGAAI
ncbi:hypothetical protein JHK84_050409 [Glycine max]|nr:hypothetical protein JHK86_050351 [Glycine max]KAG5094821.1 hypothetical protein JHK84_050409 [Glycine max]